MTALIMCTVAALGSILVRWASERAHDSVDIGMTVCGGDANEGEPGMAAMTIVEEGEAKTHGDRRALSSEQEHAAVASRRA